VVVFKGKDTLLTSIPAFSLAIVAISTFNLVVPGENQIAAFD
jgi:hypothetical protein